MFQTPASLGARGRNLQPMGHRGVQGKEDRDTSSRAPLCSSNPHVRMVGVFSPQPTGRGILDTALAEAEPYCTGRCSCFLQPVHASDGGRGFHRNRRAEVFRCHAFGGRSIPRIVLSLLPATSAHTWRTKGHFHRNRWAKNHRYCAFGGRTIPRRAMQPLSSTSARIGGGTGFRRNRQAEES